MPNMRVAVIAFYEEISSIYGFSYSQGDVVFNPGIYYTEEKPDRGAKSTEK